MEAKLVIKASELTKDFMDGLIKVFSNEATLNITVTYELENLSGQTPKRRGPKPGSTETQGKKRGPKPKTDQGETTDATPKKRGRKPKVTIE